MIEPAVPFPGPRLVRSQRRKGTVIVGLIGGNRHRSLHSLALDHLGLMIGRGELAAGAQINPDEVCEQLSISRSVLREALRVLQDKGMVEARTRLGTRVLPDERWNLLDRDVILWRV